MITLLMSQSATHKYTRISDEGAASKVMNEATSRFSTTTPNTLSADIHDRIPVILPDDAYDRWLDPDFQKVDEVCDLLKPFNANLMRRYEVSSRVNLVKNDDAACAEPLVREAAADMQ
jgi:putative SOS response-associated peptidase YedK